MEEQQTRWKIADLWTFLKNSFMAILKGEFLLRLNIGRYFIHICYTFFLIGMVIWISLSIESTLTRVEKNKNTLHEMEILLSEKTYEVARLSRRSTVEATLERLGSAVHEPEQPASILTK